MKFRDNEKKEFEKEEHVEFSREIKSEQFKGNKQASIRNASSNSQVRNASNQLHANLARSGQGKPLRTADSVEPKGETSQKTRQFKSDDKAQGARNFQDENGRKFKNFKETDRTDRSFKKNLQKFKVQREQQQAVKLLKKQNPYIFYDTDPKTRTDARHDKVESLFIDHDKQALRQTEKSDGTKKKIAIQFKYSSDGKLKGNVKIDKKFIERDKIQFVSQSITVAQEKKKAIENFAEDDSEALLSKQEEKVEKLFLHQKNNFLDRKHRTKTALKTSKKEMKQLRRDAAAATDALAEELAQEDKVGQLFLEEKQDTSDTPKQINSKEKPKEVAEYFMKETDAHKVFVDSRSKHDKHFISADKTNDKMQVEMVATTRFLPTQQNADKPQKENHGSTLQNVGRSMTKEEQLEQQKAEIRALKKEKRKLTKKAAVRASTARMLDAKKNLQNDVSDVNGSNLTGDLIHDGSTGLMQTVKAVVWDAGGRIFRALSKQVANMIGNLMKALMPLFMTVLVPVLVVGMAVGGLFLIVSNASGGTGQNGVDLTVNGNGVCYQSVSQQTVDNVIQELYDTYGSNMDETRETILRYAFSKVGCPYNQSYHGNLTADIFDCSSYAYRSYQQVGIDISNGGIYTAAEECRAMDNAGKTVTEGELLPGDVIFYSYESNGRYKNISHVVIYVGKVTQNGQKVDKALEAYNDRLGVVYNDCSSKAVSVARPLK